MSEMVRGTPEQIAEINNLATEWYAEASHPLVAAGAAMTVMMNVLQSDVAPEDRMTVIAAWMDHLHRHFAPEN